ncbi:RNA polymerase sigma factor [Nocardia yunnanensis]|uniref:RNA polymerase sigma factor n=1 Tax=Nocardia yunnanensis TaxID=2382165 RepID=A0A386ZNZ3_9NOCA|nr:RNA polymerase sigma factor [Nocardia yunnanensis]AYF78419.1 RNA polymerase sigma factor [Nocardia yunnanensis]
MVRRVESERQAQPVPSSGSGRELRLVSGDSYASWEAVYKDNVTWVYALMFGKVGNKPDAEDLTAEVFMAALKPLRITASAPEVRAYLRATARTVLAAHWKARMGREITTIEGDIADDPPEELPDSGAEARAKAVLDELPDRYRSILELRFLQGLSVKEAAQSLGVTVANAKVMQHRALQMASQLNERGVR